jgi:hypothetical protein
MTEQAFNKMMRLHISANVDLNQKYTELSELNRKPYNMGVKIVSLIKPKNTCMTRFIDTILLLNVTIDI